jgi:xanthine dehydrogenase YagR molybdenum-binding subunit
MPKAFQIADKSAVVRRDAVLKAAGAAKYAADFKHADVAYAALTRSTVARGLITAIDTSAAEAVPGVQLVLTHRSFNQDLGKETFAMKGGHMQSSFMPLTSDAIHYAGQIVALVVADTQEAAEEASGKITIAYAAEPASIDMDDPGHAAQTDDKSALKRGDADAALKAAPVSVDHHYETPAQHHNPIELYATTAAWNGAKLLVNVPTQWVAGTRDGLASTARRLSCPRRC